MLTRAGKLMGVLGQVGRMVCLACALALWAGPAPAGPGSGAGADILFAAVRGAVPAEVTDALWRDVFAAFLAPSPDGTGLVDEGGRPAPFRAEVRDLNADGVDEIFVIGGNAFLSGFTGSSIWLFIRRAGGAYEPEFGFPAFAYEVLPETRAGFPDLRFGGPGFCWPVWRWDGARYTYLRSDGECSSN